MMPARIRMPALGAGIETAAVAALLQALAELRSVLSANSGNDPMLWLARVGR